MPLRIQPLPYRADSSVLFESIRHLPWPVFLDSARPMVEQGRYDIITADPFQTLVTRGEITEIQAAGVVSLSSEDPFRLLRKQLSFTSNPSDAVLPFSGGAIGYFSYDLARRIERLPTLTAVNDPMPEMAVGIYAWALLVDHEDRSCWLVGQGKDAKTEANWESLIDLFTRPGQQRQGAFRLSSPLQSNLNFSDYCACFNRIQSYIHEGDCYQVNFAQRFQAEVEGDSWISYKNLRRVNPAPFSAYLETPFGDILSSSPERFLQLVDGHVQTCPIKGTLARSFDPREDQLRMQQLAKSLKDRAENLMIVDLLRNDIGRVCRIGTVDVSRMFAVESFARVHHLMSTIEGELAQGEDALSLLRACFPGGSITGVPKLRAMEIIEELEGLRRGVYCGAIGYVGFDGRMDTNIAIRTLVKRKDKISFWAGGGVVADSSVESEYQETLDKAAGIIEALGDVS